jgi:hypothetical protein
MYTESIENTCLLRIKLLVVVKSAKEEFFLHEQSEIVAMSQVYGYKKNQLVENDNEKKHVCICSVNPLLSSFIADGKDDSMDSDEDSPTQAIPQPSGGINNVRYQLLFSGTETLTNLA